VGVLGLHVSESLHGAVHRAVGSEAPQGYDHQTSAGGEPTARYMIARHNLAYADPTGHADVKTNVEGSVGFLTETSAAVSLRIGRLDTPWWSFAPELADYIAAPTPAESLGVQREAYFFAGARVKARVYNALLQGQVRHSDVRYSFDEIEPIVAEGWIGVMTQLFPNTEVSYALYYQTAELRSGKAARDSFGAVCSLRTRSDFLRCLPRPPDWPSQDGLFSSRVGLTDSSRPTYRPIPRSTLGDVPRML
jgi:hypothetical protein